MKNKDLELLNFTFTLLFNGLIVMPTFKDLRFIPTSLWRKNTLTTSNVLI